MKIEKGGGKEKRGRREGEEREGHRKGREREKEGERKGVEE